MRDETDQSLSWPGPRGGSGCTNEDCPAADSRRTVFLRRELETVFKTPAARTALPFEWPLPEDIEYACTRCGWFYTDRKTGTTFETPAPDPTAVPLTLEELGVSIDPEAPPGVMVQKLVRAAPEDTTAEEIARLAERRVPGASREMIEQVLDRMEAEDLVRFPAASFM